MRREYNMKIRFMIVVVLIALLLIGSKIAHAETISYTSYNHPSEWAKEAVTEAIIQGLVPEEKYPLDFHKPISRVDFSSLIVRVYEKITGYEIQERAYFQDTNDAYVEKVAGLGIVAGVGDGNFNPNASLTREQAATILHRLLSALDHPYTKPSTALYSDNLKISNWASESVQQLRAEGILTGVGENNFAPQDTYTFEQAIVTVLRTYEHHLATVYRLPDEAYVEQDLSVEYIKTQMFSLKSEYPTGLTWTNDDFYAWKGGLYSGGYGCAGFAFMLSDEAFGELPARKHTNFDNVRVGDVVRINDDTHSVIILDIQDDTYTIAEANYNSAVKWGRTFTKTEFLKVIDYVLTRYPE